jgi:hypothetical protein
MVFTPFLTLQAAQVSQMLAKQEQQMQYWHQRAQEGVNIIQRKMQVCCCLLDLDAAFSHVSMAIVCFLQTLANILCKEICMVVASLSRCRAHTPAASHRIPQELPRGEYQAFNPAAVVGAPAASAPPAFGAPASVQPAGAFGGGAPPAQAPAASGFVFGGQACAVSR